MGKSHPNRLTVEDIGATASKYLEKEDSSQAAALKRDYDIRMGQLEQMTGQGTDTWQSPGLLESYEKELQQLRRRAENLRSRVQEHEAIYTGQGRDGYYDLAAAVEEGTDRALPTLGETRRFYSQWNNKREFDDGLPPLVDYGAAADTVRGDIQRLEQEMQAHNARDVSALTSQELDAYNEKTKALRRQWEEKQALLTDLPRLSTVQKAQRMSDPELEGAIRELEGRKKRTREEDWKLGDYQLLRRQRSQKQSAQEYDALEGEKRELTEFMLSLMQGTQVRYPEHFFLDGEEMDRDTQMEYRKLGDASYSNRLYTKAAQRLRELEEEEQLGRGYFDDLLHDRRLALDKEELERKQQEWTAYAQEHPIESFFRRAGASLFRALGVNSLVEEAVRNRGHENREGNTYGSGFDAYHYRKTVGELQEEQLDDALGGIGLGKALYGTASGLAESALTLPAKLLPGGGVITKSVLGAADKVIEQARAGIDRGANPDQTMVSALGSLALSVTLDTVLAHKLGEAVDSRFLTREKAARLPETLKEVLRDTGIGVSTDLLEEAGNRALDEVVLGRQSQLSQEEKTYRLQGMSHREARLRVLGDVCRDFGAKLYEGLMSHGVESGRRGLGTYLKGVPKTGSQGGTAGPGDFYRVSDGAIRRLQ